MMRGLLWLLPLLAGAAMATQAAINGQLRAAVHSPFGAVFISFLVGTLTAGGVLLASGQALPPWPQLRAVPPHLYTGGLLGAFFVTATAVAVPRLGAASVFSGVVAGQLLLALLVDHFRWLGVPGRVLTLGRGLGLLLLLLGVYLLNRKY